MLLVSQAKRFINQNIDYKIGPLCLAPTKAVEILGVMIDDQLTFSHHEASVSLFCHSYPSILPSC